MLKILQARLQQYVNRELLDVQAAFRKARGTRDQIANICRHKSKTVPEKHLLLLYKVYFIDFIGCILPPCLFNLYAEYIMRNAGLEEAQAGIKIVKRNINNLRYTDDTTLMTEREELRSHLIKVKEESEKFGLKLNIQKTKIMASGPITS